MERQLDQTFVMGDVLEKDANEGRCLLFKLFATLFSNLRFGMRGVGAFVTFLALYLSFYVLVS
jgi:hypothetical protein